MEVKLELYLRLILINSSVFVCLVTFLYTRPFLVVLL